MFLFYVLKSHIHRNNALYFKQANLFLKEKEVKNFRTLLKNIVFSPIIISLFTTLSVSAQTIGDYKAVASGNWSSTLTWNYYNGTSWVAATSYPGQSANTKTVTISSGYVITLDVSISTYTISNLIITGVSSTSHSTLQFGTARTLNVLNLTITDYGYLEWTDKVTLTIPNPNAIIEVINNGLITTSTNCTNNHVIIIGTSRFAACNGSGNVDYTFTEVNDAGGSLRVTATSNAPICQTSNLQLNSTAIGLGNKNATITWKGTGPNNYTYLSSKTTTSTDTVYNITLSGLVSGNYTFTSTVQDNTHTQYTNSQTLSVVVYPASVSGTASASPATICYGNTSTLTLSDYTGNIQWQQSANGSTGWVNITDATIATYTTPALTSTTYYRAVVTNGICSGAISNTVAVTVFENVWVGTNSTDWGTTSNWLSGCIPISGANITFSTSSINNLILDTDRIVGNLTNNSSKQLIIPAGKSLTINGTVIGSATSDDVNKIQIKGGNGVTNGSLIFGTPLSNQNVYATVEMYSKAYKGTEQLWAIPETNPVEYKIVSYRWQYFGIPVRSVIASPTFNGSWVREYNESINMDEYYNKWTQLINNSVLSPFSGYEITQTINNGESKLFTIQGRLNVRDTILTLTKTDISGSKNYGSGYNIFGNSYVSAIRFSKIGFPASGVEKTVYLYNTGSLYDWGIETGTGGSYYSVPVNSASITSDDQIPSMQGFLLIAETNGSQVTIPYSSTSKNTIAQKAKNINNKISTNKKFSDIKIDVEGKNDYGHEIAWIFEEEGTSHAFDNGWDGYKISHIQGLKLYSNEAIGNLQVNTISKIDSIFLAFEANKDETDYTLTIRSENILNKYDNLVLIDLDNGTITKIDKDSISYLFTSDNYETSSNRFLITNYEENNYSSNYDFVVHENPSKNVIINNKNNQDGNIIVYSLDGKALYSKFCPANTKITIPPELSTGVYLVKLTLRDGSQKIQKLVFQ